MTKRPLLERVALVGLLAGVISTCWLGLSSHLMSQRGELAVVPLYVWLLGFGVISGLMLVNLRRGMIEAVTTPTFVLAALVLAYAGWHSQFQSDDDWLLRSAHLTTGMGVYVLSFSLSRQSLGHVWHTFFVLTIAVALNGAFAAWQMITGWHAPWSTYAVRFDVLDTSGQFGRPVGLSWDPVSFGYATAGIVAAAAVFLIVRERAYARRFTLAIIACVAFGILGLAVTASRSGMLGAVIGTAVGLFLARNSSKRQEVVAAGITAVAVLSVSYGPAVAEYVTKEGVLTDARLFETWRSYFPAVLANPLGNRDALVDGAVRLNMVEAGRQLYGGTRMDVGYVLQYAPHNGFLTAGVVLGWLGVIALAGIYVSGISNCLHISEYYTTIGAVLLASIMGVLVHGWFHNRSFLIGEIGNWVILGCAAGAARSLPRKMDRTYNHDSQGVDNGAMHAIVRPPPNIY